MRKLPQLTLRDLFWLVALVAMGCGWALTALACRHCSADKFDAYVEGYGDGLWNAHQWWTEKVHSTDEPEIHAALTKLVNEQPLGGKIDVPDRYWP